MYAYPTMVEDECKLYVAYSIMTRRDWKEIQDRTANKPDGGGIYIAEIDLVNGILTGKEAILLNEQHSSPQNTKWCSHGGHLECLKYLHVKRCPARATSEERKNE